MNVFFYSVLAQSLGIGEWLGWATTLLDQLGLTNFIRALLVIVMALVVLRRLFGGSGE